MTVWASMTQSILLKGSFSWARMVSILIRGLLLKVRSYSNPEGCPCGPQPVSALTLRSGWETPLRAAAATAPLDTPPP